MFMAIDHKRFRSRREEMGFSQGELATLTGLTQSTISRSERHPGSVKSEKFELYVKALQVSREWLRGDADAPVPGPIVKAPVPADEPVVAAPIDPPTQTTLRTPPEDVVPLLQAIDKAPEGNLPKPNNLRKAVQAKKTTGKKRKVTRIKAKAPKPRPAPNATPAGEFDDILTVLSEERRKGTEVARQRVAALRSTLSHYFSSLSDSMNYALISLEDYERALDADVVAEIRGRITGTPPATTSGESAHTVLDQIVAMEGVAMQAASDLKKLLGTLPPRAAKVAPVVIPAPVSAPAADTNPEVPASKPADGFHSEPAPEEVPNPVKAKKFLLIGGAYPAHPDIVRNIRKVLGVDIECIPTPKGNVKGAENAASRIRGGSVDGVVLMSGFVSHSISNQIRLAVEVTETPIGYSHGNSYAQVLKAVKSALNPGHP